MKNMGNKAILMSIRPQYVAKILNGEKTIEVRKKFPKDYVGWVYIYCTKGKPYLKQCEHYRVLSNTEIANKGYYLNGKVVARFWCDKVEHFEFETISRDIDGYWWDNGNLVEKSFITKQCCLTTDEFRKYIEYGDGYTIHISRLEVFDKPKELKELKTRHYPQFANMEKNTIHYELVSVKKAPQSYMFVEGE